MRNERAMRNGMRRAVLGALMGVALMPVAALVRSALTVLAPPDATGRRTPAGPCCADLCVAVAGQILTWRWLAQVWMQTPS